MKELSLYASFDKPSYGDIHTHSNYTDGVIFCDGMSSPIDLVEMAEEMGMNFLGITDHDTIVPSIIAQNHAIKQGYRVDVLIGEEVSTEYGHILAYNINDNIPFGMSVEETVRSIHEQKGFAVAAHPFYKVTPSIGGEKVIQVGQHEDPQVYWDGIEVFNASVNDFRWYERLTRFSDGNKNAQGFYTKHKDKGNFGIPTGGSDTHVTGVGRALTAIPEGTTIYQAFRSKEAGVVITGKKERYSPANLYSINKKAKITERVRRQMDTPRKFAVSLPSTYGQ